jgi:hypothetical protein
MAFTERVKTGMEWLEHGKTVVEILIALGGGAGVHAALNQWTKLPSVWIHPIWLLASAFFLWLIMKIWPKVAYVQQQSGQLVGGDVSLAQVDHVFNSIDHRITGDVEANIRMQIQKLPVGEQRETFLVRGATALIVCVQFEEIWHNIFGSQIKVLQQLNGEALKRATIFGYYADAALDGPQMYSGYSFDKWLGFMRSELLLKEDGELIRITVKGRAFLKFLVEEGRTAAQRAF